MHLCTPFITKLYRLVARVYSIRIGDCIILSRAMISVYTKVYEYFIRIIISYNIINVFISSLVS